MSKRDELMKAGASNALESMGAGGVRATGLPPGMQSLGALAKPAHLEGTSRDKAALRIAIDRIAADPDQPRTEFKPEELERLAESLKARGQLQPVRVRWDGQGERYVLIMGERRWRAAQLAGLPELSCVVHEGDLDDGERLALQLVENALRSDLTPIEQARAYRRLIDAQGWSARQLAAELQLAPTTVTRALTLLELPAAVQDKVDAGELPARVAYEVSKLDAPDLQSRVAEAVIEQGLRGDEVSELVSAIRAKRPTPAPRPEPVTIDLGDGVAVRVTWKRASEVDVIKALSLALKRVREQRHDVGAA